MIENKHFYVSVGVTVLLIGAAIFLQETTGDIPDWLATGLTGGIGFVFGLQTTFTRED